MDSLSKNQIKFIKSLHQKKQRQEHQLFLIEGEKLVNEVLRDKPEIIEWLIIKKNYAFEKEISKPVYFIDDAVFASISTLSTPPPIMAVCKFLPHSTELSINLNSTFSFYLDNINDPGNLGTIIRICDWFGISKIHCSPNTVELYNPKTIQASKGSFLRVNVIYIPFEKLNLSPQTIVYAADTKGTNIYQTSLKSGLIILGNEANGISPSLKNYVHQYLTIPKHPNSKAESLNVAMSAAIIASEFSRPFLL